MAQRKRQRGGGPQPRRVVDAIFGSSDPAQIHEVIATKGISGKALVTTLKLLDLRADQLALVLAQGERTFSRRATSRKALPPAEADRLYRLLRIADLAAEMIGDADKARRWLLRPVPALGGRTPLNMLRTEAGTAQVERVLYTIAYGGVA